MLLVRQVMADTACSPARADGHSLLGFSSTTSSHPSAAFLKIQGKVKPRPEKQWNYETCAHKNLGQGVAGGWGNCHVAAWVQMLPHPGKPPLIGHGLLPQVTGAWLQNAGGNSKTVGENRECEWWPWVWEIGRGSWCGEQDMAAHWTEYQQCCA